MPALPPLRRVQARGGAEPGRAESLNDDVQPRWWAIRAVGSLRPATYTCPICRERLPALSEHVLLLPEGNAQGRRHAHTQCVRTARRSGRLPSRDEWRRTQASRWTRLRARLGRSD
jgi:hypothetical protein